MPSDLVEQPLPRAGCTGTTCVPVTCGCWAWVNGERRELVWRKLDRPTALRPAHTPSNGRRRMPWPAGRSECVKQPQRRLGLRPHLTGQPQPGAVVGNQGPVEDTQP